MSGRIRTALLPPARVLFGSRKRLAFLSAVVALTVGVIGAIAYFSSTGTGDASASVGSLTGASISAPDNVTSPSVTITWDAQGAVDPSSENSSITYTVERKLNSGSYAALASGGCSGSLPYSTASCTDTLPASPTSGTYTYRVVATYHSWTAMSNEESVSANLDITPPTVDSINRADPTPTNASSVEWDVKFSEDVTGVDATDFALAGTGTSGAGITGVSGSGDTYTVTADTGADGTLGLDLVDDDSITDGAGNTLGGTGTSGAGDGSFTGQLYSVDRSAPDVSTIDRTDSTPTNATTVHWDVTFSESVSGVDASDFNLVRTGGVTGGSVTGVAGSGSGPYTVTATSGSGDGTLGVNLVDDDSIADGVGNKLGGTGTSGAGDGSFTGQVYDVDKTAPTVSSINRKSGSANPTNAASLDFTVTFSEPVGNVVAARFAVTTSNTGGAASTVSTVTPNGGPAPASSWTVSVDTSATTGQNNGSVRLDLTSIGSIQDPATNPLAAAHDGDESYTFDTTQPTVSSINRKSGSANPTNAASLDFTVTFSEPVSNVVAARFAVTTSNTGGTAPTVSTVTPNGGPAPATAWTVTVDTSATTGQDNGSVRLDLTSVGSIQDQATNLLAATHNGDQTYTFDTTKPTVSSINRKSGSANPTNAASLDFTVTFSEPVGNVLAARFAVTTSNTGGTAPSVSTVTPNGGPAPATAWTVTVDTSTTTGQNNGSIRLDLTSIGSIQDQATNLLAATHNGDESYTFDTTKPTVTSINRSGSSPTNSSSVSWDVTFSESVAGVAAGNFTLAITSLGGTPAITGVSGSGTSWSVTASTGTGNGTLGLNQTSAGAVTDAAGNVLAGTQTGQVYAIDKTAPTVSSIDRAGSTPTNAGSVSWTVTFSESVSGVDSADFALAASGVSGASITSVTGSGPYTVTASTGTGSGTLGLNLVDDDSIQDAAGNKLGGTGTGNGNFTGQTYTIDKSVPTVSSINRVGATPTNASSVSWTVTFSENVTGVDSGDFALAGAGTSGASITNATGSNSSYTVTASTGVDGTLGLNLVDNDTIQDGVGNKLGGTGTGNGNFTGQTYTVDKSGPTLSSVVAANCSPCTIGTIDKKNSSQMDTLTFNYSDASGVDPASIVSGWNGSGTQTLSVTFTNNDSTCSGNADSISVPGIGKVCLGSQAWLTSSSTHSEDLSRSSTNVFVLSMTNPPTGAATGVAASSFTWSASSGTAKDVAGNSASGSVTTASQRF